MSALASHFEPDVEFVLPIRVAGEQNGRARPWLGRAVRRLWENEGGADLVEYVVLAALFALVLGIAMSGLDGVVRNNFSATTTDLTVPVTNPD